MTNQISGRPAILDRIARSLDTLRSKSLLRTARVFDDSVRLDMATNSYLGLHENQTLKRAAQELAAQQFGGNLASRLVYSATPLFEALEAEIADWKQCEAALIYNSGYAANIGIIQALAQRGTAVFSDRLNHASIVDGIRLSGAKLHRYNHCDTNHLKALVESCKDREKLIVTDTVFSMDGDRAPLAEICAIARENNCLVMVDEAHASGVLGPTGAGLVEELDLEGEVHVRMGTMSKAIAGLGGFFAGTRTLRDYLVNTSRSLIYSTGLPHSSIAFDLASVRYIRATPGLGKQLLERAKEFRTTLANQGFDTLNASTQIVPCVLGSEEQALSASAFLREQGLRVPAIRPPTVPKGTSRLRFSLHLGLTKKDIDETVGLLSNWKRTND